MSTEGWEGHCQVWRYSRESNEPSPQGIQESSDCRTRLVIYDVAHPKYLACSPFHPVFLLVLPPFSHPFLFLSLSLSGFTFCILYHPLRTSFFYLCTISTCFSRTVMWKYSYQASSALPAWNYFSQFNSELHFFLFLHTFKLPSK